ncbi:MAG TPA: hypothetical protein VGA49_00385 [Patescibacteria group bacterium]
MFNKKKIFEGANLFIGFFIALVLVTSLAYAYTLVEPGTVIDPPFGPTEGNVTLEGIKGDPGAFTGSFEGDVSFGGNVAVGGALTVKGSPVAFKGNELYVCGATCTVRKVGSCNTSDVCRVTDPNPIKQPGQKCSGEQSAGNSKWFGLGCDYYTAACACDAVLLGSLVK